MSTWDLRAVERREKISHALAIVAPVLLRRDEKAESLQIRHGSERRYFLL
jgi:hypothetical protein